jgi:hypothetical protein
MRIETNLREVSFDNVGSAARLAEEIGFDGIAQSEVRIQASLIQAIRYLFGKPGIGPVNSPSTPPPDRRRCVGARRPGSG